MAVAVASAVTFHGYCYYYVTVFYSVTVDASRIVIDVFCAWVIRVVGRKTRRRYNTIPAGLAK